MVDKATSALETDTERTVMEAIENLGDELTRILQNQLSVYFHTKCFVLPQD